MIVKKEGRLRFLHIGFSDQMDVNTLQPAFDLAKDWLRYAPNCWIVYTNSDPEKWYSRILKVLPEPKSQGFAIFEIDVTTKHGQLQEWIWNWLERPR
jgi:hypothetical protein